MVQQTNNFIRLALQLFLGEDVADMVRHDDDTITFVTADGDAGFVGPNYLGNWDIWIGEEVVYEVEGDLYEVVNHRKDENLIELYNYMRELDQTNLKYKSRKFLETVQIATENVILNYSLPLKGEAVIGSTQVIYKNNKKVKINLN